MTDTEGGEFEEAIHELEATVQRLDTAQGELSLQETIALYERGMILAQRCSEALDAAELQVQKLSLSSSEQQIEMFFEEE
ncbi:exodeoxyribonuclease VII small subunit [Chloroflexota bacterium]